MGFLRPKTPPPPPPPTPMPSLPPATGGDLDKEKKNPNNESIDDTLTDIANYCVMAQIVRRGNWGK